MRVADKQLQQACETQIVRDRGEGASAHEGERERGERENVREGGKRGSERE